MPARSLSPLPTLGRMFEPTLATGPFFLAQALGDAVVVCLHSEPDSPFVLPRTRVSPDTAPLPPAFLSALKTPPFNAPSPMRSGREFSPVAEAAIAAAQEEGKPGLIKYVPDGLVGPIVDAFGVLSAADATDKRERCVPQDGK